MSICSFLDLKKNTAILSGIALTGMCAAAYADSGSESVRTACTAKIVDSFSLKPLASSAGYSSLTDLHGNFFVAGSAYDQNNRTHWVVRRSIDNGLTWQTVDDFLYQADADTKQDSAPVLGKDPRGNLYAAGFGFDNTGKVHWIVRKSTDDGTTWNTVDDFKYSIGSATMANGFTSDSNGNLYVSGYGYSKTGYTWLVRKSSDAGSTWNLVDQFQLTKGSASETTNIASDTNGNVFATGIGNTRWIVRKTADAGITWNIVDNFQNQANYSLPRAVTADKNNHLYSAGTGTVSEGGSAWIVRKSTDGGQSWATVDTFQLASGKRSEAKALTSDANGNLYATGSGEDANGTNWVTRQSTDGGATWTTIETFQFRKGKMAMGKTVWTDANGNIFTAGMAGSRWMVRELSCE
jgi:hypothetical protein